MTTEPNGTNASSQIRHAIHEVIRRYGQESDITLYQVIGVLEVVKLDLVDALDRRDSE